MIRGNKPTLIVPDEVHTWQDYIKRPKKIRPYPLSPIVSDEFISITTSFDAKVIKANRPANYDDILGKYFK